LQGGLDHRVSGAIITFSECAALLAAFVIILSMLGVNVNALLLPAGVALAFAAKDLSHNFLAGARCCPACGKLRPSSAGLSDYCIAGMVSGHRPAAHNVARCCHIVVRGLHSGCCGAMQASSSLQCSLSSWVTGWLSATAPRPQGTGQHGLRASEVATCSFLTSCNSSETSILHVCCMQKAIIVAQPPGVVLHGALHSCKHCRRQLSMNMSYWHHMTTSAHAGAGTRS
jgi:hypothetical protein